MLGQLVAALLARRHSLAALLIIAAGLATWQPWSMQPATIDKIVCARDITVRDAARSKTVIATFRRHDTLCVNP